MAKKKCTFLWASNVGVAEYRFATPFLALWKSKKIKVDINPIDPKRQTWAEWVDDLVSGDRDRIRYRHILFGTKLEDTDIIVMEAARQHGIVTFQCQWQQEVKRPMIVSIDDYVLDVDPSMMFHKGLKRGAEPLSHLMHSLELADALIVSTEYLKKMYAPFNKHIYVCGNYLNLKDWNKLQITEFPVLKKRGVLRLIWEGAYSHAENLGLIEEPVYRLLKKYPDTLDFVIVGMNPKSKWRKLKNYHVQPSVFINEWPQLLKNLQGDIGLAPLVDTSFMRSKSNLRWMTHSAVKMPTVASDVLPYKEAAWLCKDAEGFYTTINEIMKKPEVLKQKGEEAHALVKKKYNFKECATVYIAAILDVLKNWKRWRREEK